jgi:hypothetical protein
MGKMRRFGPVGIVLAAALAVVLVLTAVTQWPKFAVAETRNKTAKTADKPVPPPAPPSAAPGTVLHLVQRGESMQTLMRKYWADSAFMTTAEFGAAVRAANPDKIKGDWPKPGETLVIPGMEGPITEKSVPVPKTFEVRAIYLTGVMAGSHNGLELIRRWRAAGGNAVVFDVKDSDGIVNIPFQNPLNDGAPRPAIPNLPKLTRWIHRQGMHAIARIAIFRDERLVTKHPDTAVQSRRGRQPWRENGKLVWTDPSRDDVQNFNILLAKAAAEQGIDEIQFDYVRFPAEGDQKDAEFAFESSHPQWKRTDVITNFLSKAYSELHPLGVLFSLDVFGVMAWQRPVDLAHTGQDIPGMAQYCDVLSPMIYPSHFFGMDGYQVPGDAPEHFISESMDRFQKITASSGVVLRPWLQAFAWKTPSYSPAYIETQVKVARDHAGIGFLFWNARNDYSKPFAAMPSMKAAKLFRGDEMPAAPAPAAAKVASAGK